MVKVGCMFYTLWLWYSNYVDGRFVHCKERLPAVWLAVIDVVSGG